MVSLAGRVLQGCVQGEVLLGVGGKGVSAGCLSPGPGCAAWGPPQSRVSPVGPGASTGLCPVGTSLSSTQRVSGGRWGSVPWLGFTVGVCPDPRRSWVGTVGSVPRLEIMVGVCPVLRGSRVGTGRFLRRREEHGEGLPRAQSVG